MGAIPDLSFDRLNRHYEPAIRLSELILRSTSIELLRGGFRASSFLFDMNKVFEDFMVTALRDVLGLRTRDFPQSGSGRRMRLDRDGRIHLKPDLSWWEGTRCVFLGDLKDKNLDHGIPKADLYQMLAYTIGADLPDGLLIYARGEDQPIKHTIQHAGKRLEIIAVDLAGSPERILAEVGEVADRIRSMRLRSLDHRAV